MPATIDTTVEMPMNDAVRFTPMLAMAILDKKKARMERRRPDTRRRREKTDPSKEGRDYRPASPYAILPKGLRG